MARSGTDLTVAVKEWAQHARTTAIEGMLDRLDDKVPIGDRSGGQSGPRLSASRKIRRLTNGAEIEYPPQSANWTDAGRRGFSVKRAKALRFVIGGQVIFRKSVGPARAQKWWTNTMTLPIWESECREALAKTRVSL